MANFHLCAKIIKRSAGRSAVAAAAYRSGETIKNERDGIVHNFNRKQGVVHTELLLPAGSPNWTRAELWNAAEATEKRADAQTAREVEISLPKELPLKQQIQLARAFALANFVERGMCADLCFHDKGDGNPHCHILLTMRPIENGDFSKKKNREWNRKELVEEWRADYCNRENTAYAMAGYDITVDHKSYKRQGIDLVPQLHKGHKVMEMERQAVKKNPGAAEPTTRIGKANADIIKHNREMLALLKDGYTHLGQLRQDILLEESRKADRNYERANDKLTEMKAEAYEVKSSWFKSLIYESGEKEITAQEQLVSKLADKKDAVTHAWASNARNEKQSPEIKQIDARKDKIAAQLPYFEKAATAKTMPEPTKRDNDKISQLVAYTNKSNIPGNWNMLSEFEKEKRMREEAQRER